ncbi:MAG: type I-B CRISPR-associated protein Cas5b [Candidatus Parvarchaeota archaeon]|nr:type I-B CRISPR-associated protein Cas5b [Candidatus Jingweiarchaeum tengchongense]
MSEKILFIKVFQPFAQYRNPFTFYYAQTYPLPPKSTIIGMLQNACSDWYGNEYGIENWWNLKISVHGGFESVFWNYQNLIKGDVLFDYSGRLINQGLPLYGEGITSQRSPITQQELFNGHLYIFIRGGDWLINSIKDGLEKPRKILYLGRSEDVVFIKKIEEISEEKIEEISDIEDDIRLTYPTYIKMYKQENGTKKKFLIKNKRYPIFSIPTKVLFKNRDKPIRIKAEITKETKREVEFEPVIYTSYNYTIFLEENEKIEAESYEVDNKKFIIIKDFGWL